MSRPLPSDPAEVENSLWDGFRGELAFDIGAHIGESLWHLTGKFRQVIALEPAHESFDLMKKQWDGTPGVTLLLQAASDHKGTLKTSMREVQMQGGQLVARDMPWKRYIAGVTPSTESLPWGREIGTREVPCQTLDGLAAIYGTPDFVKIDTEGHEAEIMRGATTILREHKTSWLIEFHLDKWLHECCEILETHGYEPEIVRHPHYEPGSALYNNHGWIKAKADE